MRLTTLIPIAVVCGLTAGMPLQEYARAESACTVAPEVVRQNYVANPPVRQDISSGLPGLPLTLRVTLIDVNTCQPLPSAMVEVWSSNAQGQYGSFLRGATLSGSNGIAQFQTIFPGFTSESANHLSIAVHQTSAMSSPTIHVGQLFFTDRWTEVVSMTTPYKSNTSRRVLNAQDPNFATATKSGYNALINVLSIQDDWPSGVTGDIIVGVDPRAPKSG